MSDLHAAAERLLTRRDYDYWEANHPTNAISDSKLVAEFVKSHDPDTSAKVALGDLALVLHEPSGLEFTAAVQAVAEAEMLLRRAGRGERSPEFLAEVIELTAKMRSTP